MFTVIFEINLIIIFEKMEVYDEDGQPQIDGIKAREMMIMIIIFEKISKRF